MSYFRRRDNERAIYHTDSTTACGIVCARTMRLFPLVLTLSLGGLPLSSALAIGQAQAQDTPGAPLPTLPADAGNPGDAQSNAAPPIVVETPSATAPPEPPVVRALEAPTSAPAPLAGCEGLYVHHGFYFRAAASLGGLSVWGDGPVSSASIAGFASGVSIAVGGSPIRGLAVAGVISSITTGGDTFHGGPTVSVTTTGAVQSPVSTLQGNARATYGMIGVLADWFPAATGGWHVGGAFGLGGASVTDDANNTIGGVSVAGEAFGGYQWWLGPSWSLGISALMTITPRLNMTKMTDSNVTDTGYQMMPLSAGLQGLLLYY